MTTRQLTLITGASRGMGLAMARARLRQGHHVVGLSRHANPELQAEADHLGVSLEQWVLDLADAGAFPDRGAFEQLYALGRLSSPEQAADAVLARLDRADFGADPVADVRD
jgi:NAD(P)-dependent dehydrogenase (short-subunit alcohol dehydrogenase family)